MPAPDARSAMVLDRVGLDRLVEVLIAEGYRVIGPTLRDGAIVLGELDSAGDLPAGWGVETGPGLYRVRRRDDEAVFGHSSGPQSWKQFLHPPRRPLWSTGSEGGFTAPESDSPRYAFLGVRGCDLAAISILGNVLGGGQHPDGAFARIRRGLFVIAANCTEPGGVCFCASMGTGPAAGPGYDIALTEQTGEPGHRFIAEPGTAEGARVLAAVPHRDPRPGELAAARAEVAEAEHRMGREMPSADLPALMRDSRESPHWQDVASRCLTCGNCTMVCPTCFCTTTEDVTDLTGDHAERWQRWASCFELDFSYVHGGSMRRSGESRYRQWISHKLGTWHDQFGTSGCVGCGRCIDWCPVGIDITAEAARLAELAELDDQPGTEEA
jgi:ferredoxin